MKHGNHAFTDNSLLGTCLMLAHSTFYDALPSNTGRRGPTAPSDVSGKRAPRANVLQRALTAVDNWFYRQRAKELEAYLAKASDVYDLEHRIRRLQRDGSL